MAMPDAGVQGRESQLPAAHRLIRLGQGVAGDHAASTCPTQRLVVVSLPGGDDLAEHGELELYWYYGS